jgi:ketosteroid isomerase-like protein
MKRLWVICVLLGAFSASAFAAGKSKADVEEQLKKMEEARAQAAMKADTATMAQGMTDDYSMVTPNGEEQEKAAVLDSFKSGDRKIESIQLEDTKVRVYGNSAVVTGTSNIKGAYKGQDISGKYRYTRVYVKQGGKWKTAAFQQTKVQ